MDLKTLHALNSFLSQSLNYLDQPAYAHYTTIVKGAFITHPAITPYYLISLLRQ